MNALTKWLPTVARVLYGLLFVVFGAEAFLHFMPPQPPPPPAAAAFAGGLFSAGYFVVLLKGAEVVTGLMLLTNRYVPLALVILAPIVINIVAFHVFLAPEGNAIAFAVLALQLYLAWVHRAAFAPLLVARLGAPEPTVVKSRSFSAPAL